MTFLANRTISCGLWGSHKNSDRSLSIAMPRSGKESGEDSGAIEEGLDDLGVSVGVKLGGVPLRRRRVLDLGRNARFA